MLSAVCVPVDAPLNVTVAPLPPAAGAIVPEILYVSCGGLVAWVLPTVPLHPLTKTTARSISNDSSAKFLPGLEKSAIVFPFDLSTTPYTTLLPPRAVYKQRARSKYWFEVQIWYRWYY